MKNQSILSVSQVCGCFVKNLVLLVHFSDKHCTLMYSLLLHTDHEMET